MQFEPFAFGLSRFDGAGRYLGEVDMAGKPLPLDGWVPTSSETESPHYSNVAEYMQILKPYGISSGMGAGRHQRYC